MGAVQQRRDEVSSGERLASRTRGHTLTSLVEATRELHGERAVTDMLAVLPSHVRRALDEKPDWVPVEFIVVWFEMMFERALGRDSNELARLVRRTLDLGFGRVRRVLLGIATPTWVIRKAPELWRGEHSDGRLVPFATGPTSVRVTLHDHPFLDSAVAREATVESLRYPLVLAGAKNAVARHEGAVGEPLIVAIDWTD